jgi:hypothetical protein
VCAGLFVPVGLAPVCSVVVTVLVTDTVTLLEGSGLVHVVLTQFGGLTVSDMILPVSGTVQTSGGDTVQFVVRNILLALPPVFVGNYTNGNNTYTSPACTVLGDSVLQCTTAPVGWGGVCRSRLCRSCVVVIATAITAGWLFRVRRQMWRGVSPRLVVSCTLGARARVCAGCGCRLRVVAVLERRAHRTG